MQEHVGQPHLGVASLSQKARGYETHCSSGLGVCPNSMVDTCPDYRTAPNLPSPVRPTDMQHTKLVHLMSFFLQLIHARARLPQLSSHQSSDAVLSTSSRTWRDQIYSNHHLNAMPTEHYCSPQQVSDEIRLDTLRSCTMSKQTRQARTEKEPVQPFCCTVVWLDVAADMS